jgi:hypothetical protein
MYGFGTLSSILREEHEVWLRHVDNKSLIINTISLISSWYLNQEL